MMREFGAHLDGHMHPAFRARGYLEWDKLEQCVNEATNVQVGVVQRPELMMREFAGFLDLQLRRIDDFFVGAEAKISAKWVVLYPPACDVETDEARSILSVLQTHMQKKCTAKAGCCSAINRLTAKGGNVLSEFTVLYEEAQQLQQLVALNYSAFNKAMDVFEAKTGLSVRGEFLPKLQKAQFYNSSGVARIVTEMECFGKELLLRADSKAPENDMREEFTCGVCLEVLRNPVVLSCSHRFCWHCAASSCVTSKKCSEWACPTCRKAQPVSEDVFKISTHLQTFIHDHVTHPPTSPDLAPAAALFEPEMPDGAGWQDFNFSGILQRKEDAHRVSQEDDVFESLPLMSADDLWGLDPSLSQASIVPPPPPRSPPPLDSKAGAHHAFHEQVKKAQQVATVNTTSQQTYIGQWVSMSDNFFDLDSLSDCEGASVEPKKQKLAPTATAVPTTEAHVFKMEVQTAVAAPVEVAAPAISVRIKNEAPAMTVVATAPSNTAAAPVKRKRGRPPVKQGLSDEERKLTRLKKNRIAAQKSYRKRIENTGKMETENETIKEKLAISDAALTTARMQWQRYADFVQRHGLAAAAEAEGLVRPPAIDKIERPAAEAQAVPA